jgi:hypothetical protein
MMALLRLDDTCQFGPTAHRQSRAAALRLRTHRGSSARTQAAFRTRPSNPALVTFVSVSVGGKLSIRER